MPSTDEICGHHRAVGDVPVSAHAPVEYRGAFAAPFCGKSAVLRTSIASLSARRPRPRVARRVRCVSAAADVDPQPLNFVPDDGGEAEVFVFDAEAPSGLSKASARETPWLCKVCNNSGFVPCRHCGASGVIVRGKSSNVFFCQECTGKKKLRCPEPPIGCGGKCYMCE